TATLLPNGQVLIAGGFGEGDAVATAERYFDDTPAQCFSQTGRCALGRFLAYWQAHGGLAINGYPLSDQRIELLEDGKPYVVQYFERARFEHHPENPAPYDVLLGQFGRRILGGR